MNLKYAFHLEIFFECLFYSDKYVAINVRYQSLQTAK
jgi:hypothetical protein